MKKLLFVFVFAAVLANNSKASAAWSMNLGWHNPPGAALGVNFLDFWTNWALELGIGWLDLNSSSRTSNTNNGGSGTSSLAVAGDINLKYLFGTDVVRPYLQGGLSAATVTSVGDNTGVAAGVGGGFIGGGIFIKGRSLYAYGSLNASSGTFWQAGLGFMF